MPAIESGPPDAVPGAERPGVCHMAQGHGTGHAAGAALQCVGRGGNGRRRHTRRACPGAAVRRGEVRPGSCSAVAVRLRAGQGAAGPAGRGRMPAGRLRTGAGGLDDPPRMHPTLGYLSPATIGPPSPFAPPRPPHDARHPTRTVRGSGGTPVGLDSLVDLQAAARWRLKDVRHHSVACPTGYRRLTAQPMSWDMRYCAQAATPGLAA